MKHLIFYGFLLILLVAGCGKKGMPVQPVQGVVKVDGQTVRGVSVTFHPVDAASVEKAFGGTDANGNYKLTSTNGPPQGGALVGEYKVTASWPETEKLILLFKDPVHGDSYTPTYEEKLPKTYQNPATSGLTATVKKGKNKIDFDLTTKP